NMASIRASERRSSLLKTVWNRLKSAVSLGPQASAASVNSCCTAETWMAEISAWVAQALAACARFAPVKHNSVAQAPARKHLFISLLSRLKRPGQAVQILCSLYRSFHKILTHPQQCHAT